MELEPNPDIKLIAELSSQIMKEFTAQGFTRKETMEIIKAMLPHKP